MSATQELIETGQYHALDQVRVYRQPVLGVGGQNELSPPQTEQVVRAQQPQDALMIHAPTVPPEFSMHAAVAVSWPPQRDLLPVRPIPGFVHGPGGAIGDDSLRLVPETPQRFF